MMLNRLLLFVMGIALGSVFLKLNMPIPYLLGGLLVAIFCKTCLYHKLHVDWPQKWRGYGLMVSGYGIGATVSADTWNNFLQELSGVIEANAIAIGISLVLAFLIHKYTHFGFKSCIMGMLPGGITVMMLMAEEDEHTDPNVVMVMQVLRLVGVVVSVPFLIMFCLNAHVTGSSISMPNHGGIHWLVFLPLSIIGWRVAKILHLPTAQMLGAILMTAIFSISFGHVQPVPGWLMAPAQASIGLYMGQLLDADKLAKTKVLVPLTVLGTAALIVVSVVVAYSLSARYGFSIITAFLAMAPGGIAEMSLAGMSMGEDVSVILTYQLVRILSINLLVPPALVWFFKDHKFGQNT